MKYLILVVFAISTYSSAYSQKNEFDFTTNVDSLYKTHPNGFAIYLSGFWCGPCIGKSKPIYQYFKTQKDSIPLFFVYDDYNYSKEKGENLLGEYFTMSNNYVIGKKYYSTKGLIQINPQKKALKKIIDELKKYPVKKGNLDELYLGQLLYFNSAKELYLIEFEYGKKITSSDLDSFINN